MNELIKSVARFGWAMSLFGVQQLANTLSPSPARQQQQPPHDPRGAFDSVARAAEEQLSESTKSAFRTGDQLQRGLVDLMFNLLTPQAFTPRGMARAALDVLQQSAAALRLVSPGLESRLAWQEFQNKLQAFNQFERVDQLPGLPSDGTIQLPELIRRADTLDPYLFVWATEGLGHYYAETVWEQRGEPRQLLTDESARDLPEKTFAALHAGMGLAFANRLLGTINSANARDDTSRALRRFVALCRENSRPGYTGAAFEALGLVARNLYPQLLHLIDRQLMEAEENLQPYFWHGVGRAIYFAPTNFLSRAGSSWRAVLMTQEEPPHELGKRNALHGLIWALTLVNIREPEILEAFLQQYGARLPESEAFSGGVSSALIIWRDSTVEDPSLRRFYQHQPDSDDPHLVQLWADLVRQPATEALQNFYPVLKKHERLGEVFRCQSLVSLVDELERGTRSDTVEAGT
jgi:hypothetical protein